MIRSRDYHYKCLRCGHTEPVTSRTVVGMEDLTAEGPPRCSVCYEEWVARNVPKMCVMPMKKEEEKRGRNDQI